MSIKKKRFFVGHYCHDNTILDYEVGRLWAYNSVSNVSAIENILRVQFKTVLIACEKKETKCVEDGFGVDGLVHGNFS